MSFRFLQKIKHYCIGKINQSKNLVLLERSGLEGQMIAQAFLKTSKGQSTPEESNDLAFLGEYRNALADNPQVISFEEIGSATKMSVSAVAQKAASPEIWTRFFYHLARSRKVLNILEIGTNLGVSGQYFLKALEGKKNGKLVTLEGVKGLCEIAEERFSNLSQNDRFEVIHGLYDASIKKLAVSKQGFDLVFIDGNHQYGATLSYFNQLKANLNHKALVIFDDIHWSRGMQQAWREICRQQGVLYSVNFYKLGVVVFDAENLSASPPQYRLFLAL